MRLAFSFSGNALPLWAQETPWRRCTRRKHLLTPPAIPPRGDANFGGFVKHGPDGSEVKADIAALAERLHRPGERSGEAPVLPYAELVRPAGTVPNFQPAKGGGALVVIENVNADGKHYRAHKSWATVDGTPVWEHPEAKRLKTWRGQAIQELGHEYVPGSKDNLKRYVSVFWVPPGKTVSITRCEHDLYGKRRGVSASRYET